MKMPSFQRLVLFALSVGVLVLGGLGLQRFAPDYLSRGFNVNASDYKLPAGTLRFDAIKPPSATEVLDIHGRVFAYLYGDKLRIYKPLSEIDPRLVNFVVQLEDAKFWSHEGFDIDEIKNSLEKNIESGKYKRGGSTITQQLAKNLFLDKKKSFARKLYEIPWAMRLERDLKKKQILELYLNTIEWGPGIYGAEAAARHFFDKPAKDLDPGQALYLALIVPNPPRFDVLAHPKTREFLESKKKTFVERMHAEKHLSDSERVAYLTADFGIVEPSREGRHFPLSHTANYLGNRSSKSLAYSHVAEWIQNGLGNAAHKRSNLRLILEADSQREIEKIPEEISAGAPAQHWVIRDSGTIRAVRWVEKGKSLASPAQPETRLSWAELIDQ